MEGGGFTYSSNDLNNDLQLITNKRGEERGERLEIEGGRKKRRKRRKKKKEKKRKEGECKTCLDSSSQINLMPLVTNTSFSRSTATRRSFVVCMIAS